MRKTLLILALAITLLAGCAKPSSNTDYTAAEEDLPASSAESASAAKQVITMAGWSMEPWIELAVEEFNKTNDEYRIEFEDYFDTYGDRTLSDADTKLLLRFSSGDIPDILCMEANSYEDYADAGLLMDMYPLMEADEAFEKGNLIANVLTAMEKDGQLLQISPFFRISTLVGYGPQVGDISAWTMDEFEEYVDSLPSDMVWIRNMSNQTFLKRLLNANIDVLLDTSGNTCAFESEAFIKMLELTSRFPSEDDLALTTYADVYDGKVAMVDFNIYSMDSINDITTIFRGQPAIVSYPSDCNTGALGSSICRLGISAVTSHSEEAWNFISSTLSQEFLDSLAGVGFGFPLNKASFENVLQKATQEPLNTGEDKIPKTLNGGLQVEDRALSQEEVDAVREYVFSIRQFGGCISTVLDIVKEEAAAYFAGDKTAEETAEIIQNRVQMYLNERG